jgi:hypothetical protein
MVGGAKERVVTGKKETRSSGALTDRAADTLQVDVQPSNETHGHTRKSNSHDVPPSPLGAGHAGVSAIVVANERGPAAYSGPRLRIARRDLLHNRWVQSSSRHLVERLHLVARLHVDLMRVTSAVGPLAG